MCPQPSAGPRPDRLADAGARIGWGTPAEIQTGHARRVARAGTPEGLMIIRLGRAVRNRLGRAARIVRSDGPAVLASKLLARVQARLDRGGAQGKRQIQMLVRYEDANAVDWSVPQPWQESPRAVVSESISTAWIMNPPGESSGGHQTIFRFMRYLEQAGHRATVYLYHPQDRALDAAYIEGLVKANPSYTTVDARFRTWPDVAPDTDVIIATGWETAYPAFLDPSPARRAYFVQDFEPSFYPVGSENVLAENTYRFGFHGLTAGRWLATRLQRDYGMATHHFDFAADTDVYRLQTTARREDVFFYARPVTARRGFELGVMALERLHQLRPGIRIHLAGWDVSDYDLPFPHIDHGIVSIQQLNAIYNRCGAALVLSLTNMSLLPLELLASGVIPVVNDGENNRMVSDNPFVEYADAAPAALARRLDEVLSRPDLADHARAASASIGRNGWDASGAQFVRAVEDLARG